MRCPAAIVDSILALYETRGAAAYSGERVSQTEHALQAAMQALRAGAPEPLVVAALLHDIGHLLPAAAEATLARRSPEGRHEARGAVFLARHFRSEVVRPVGLHVAAKRYLCAVEPGYADRLSPASVRSLALQGGPLADREVRAFERRAGSRDAVALRRWDDAAKVPRLRVPGLAYYRPLLEDCLGGRRR
jgi:phosphonate degradation associated HDIG domain protein